MIIVLKATLAILLTFALVAAARRARASLRHLLFASLFLFLLLLPFASRVTVSRTLDLTVTPEVARVVNVPAPQNAAAQATPAETTKSINWMAIARNIYFGVAALLVLMLATGIWRLRRMAANGDVWLEGTARMNELAVEAGIRRAALVILSSETTVPLTFGFRRSTIVLPEDARAWSIEELRCALRHELEHVRREDWVAQLLARVVCAIYWAHPLVWIAWRRFCFEAERACDDAVIDKYAEAEDYAGQLVSLAKSVRFTMVPALGMASRSRLSQRVRALLDPSQRRGPLGTFAMASAIAATFFLLLTVAPARLIAAAAPDHDKRDREHSRETRNWSAMGEALTEAAERGRIDVLKHFLDAGIDVNTVAEGDGTALIGASRGGHADVVRFLIERGADVNLASRGDGNPLIAASGNGYVGIVEILLDAGANLDEVVPGDENPLIQAAWNGHEDVVRLLIQRNADVNVRVWADGELRTPLRMARKHRHDRIVSMLIAAGARE